MEIPDHDVVSVQTHIIGARKWEPIESGHFFAASILFHYTLEEEQEDQRGLSAALGLNVEG
jgi:hypothetical protein